MSAENTTQESAHNDGWSATNTIWGEDFLLEIEASGRESVGERAVLAADEAATEHFKETDCYHPPKDGKPNTIVMDETSVEFVTEHASLTLSMYRGSHSDEQVEDVFELVEDTLDDASDLSRVSMAVEESWSRASEVSA